MTNNEDHRTSRINICLALLRPGITAEVSFRSVAFGSAPVFFIATNTRAWNGLVFDRMGLSPLATRHTRSKKRTPVGRNMSRTTDKKRMALPYREYVGGSFVSARVRKCDRVVSSILYALQH